MQYSPKLKTAMNEIKQVLKKHDIAGFVMIHSPDGFTEYLNHINPSYSCAFLENDQLRVRLKTSEVGRVKAQKLASDTFNMATHFADTIESHAVMYRAFQRMLKHHWGGEEGGGTHTSHSQQNN